MSLHHFGLDWNIAAIHPSLSPASANANWPIVAVGLDDWTSISPRCVFGAFTVVLLSGRAPSDQSDQSDHRQQRNITVIGPGAYIFFLGPCTKHKLTQPLQTIALPPWRGSPCNSHPANQPLIITTDSSQSAKFINANSTAWPGFRSQMLSQTQISEGAHFPTYET